MTAPATLPDDVLDHTAGLFRHTKRPDWGVAILAWEEGGRRAYQFDDGKLRVLKEGFYALMEPVERAAEGAVRADLEEAIVVNQRHRQRAPLKAAMPFEDQVRGFLAAYPEGFRDVAWARDVRGDGAASPKKKHRDPAVRDAQALLGEAALTAAIEAGEHTVVCEAVATLLRTTDLVAIVHAKAMADMAPSHHESVTTALHSLLHGAGEYGVRFRAWVAALEAALGAKPSWRLATALPALVQPQDHVCVQPSTFKRQAGVIAPSRLYSKAPRRRGYDNFLHVAVTVRAALDKEGLQPRDLLDVHDFIWTTLRPAALPKKT